MANILQKVDDKIEQLIASGKTSEAKKLENILLKC